MDEQVKRSEQEEIIERGKRVIAVEQKCLHEVGERLDGEFARAVEVIMSLQRHERVIASGMGKAGLIAQKVAATFASTGTRSFFVHPAEAMHGDLGMFNEGDIALLFSHSGESEEVCRLIPHLEKLGVTRIAITKNHHSTMARGSDIIIQLGEIEEACPLALAPSSSTTAMVAVGDALALTVLELQGFDKTDFATLHPGGSLGLKLRRVSEVMRQGDDCPIVSAHTTVSDTISAISKARAGCACVVGERGKLLGVFTDGDFRRAWAHDPHLGRVAVGEVMTAPGIHTRSDTLVGEAKESMLKFRINALPVLDGEGKVVGLLDLQDV